MRSAKPRSSAPGPGAGRPTRIGDPGSVLIGSAAPASVTAARADVLRLGKVLEVVLGVVVPEPVDDGHDRDLLDPVGAAGPDAVEGDPDRAGEGLLVEGVPGVDPLAVGALEPEVME